ncbi:imidazolonepropionase [Massilia sp. W12]|uniref:imidazolonepropionase n=1 Tax=Massilia sp. W12 TaxID=3126507 RepID=UPI0030CA9267
MSQPASEWDVLIRNANLARLLPQGSGYDELQQAAIALQDGKIAWLGTEEELPAQARAHSEIDAQGGWLTPGLIDCHTHIVHAGRRSNEFEMRLHGATYQEIAAAGGGIMSTVRATRAATEADLLAQSLPRVQALLAEGVTTLEIKSGYGLDLASEASMLRVARRLGEMLPVAVCTTFLGAHALPPEYAARADDYIDHLCREMLPALHAQGLVDAVDAFCENIGFTRAQTERLFQAARARGLPVKLHAEQLSDQDGSALTAAYAGLSADHLEWLSESGIAAMRQAGTVAVLLPAAFYFLRETKLPPIAELRAAGVPIALASDCNPGTAPITSLLLVLNMACTLFRMTPQEALRGVTCHGARALGLADRGSLEVGKRADLALWRIERPADLAYMMGFNPLQQVWYGGKPCRNSMA